MLVKFIVFIFYLQEKKKGYFLLVCSFFKHICNCRMRSCNFLFISSLPEFFSMLNDASKRWRTSNLERNSLISRWDWTFSISVENASSWSRSKTLSSLDMILKSSIICANVGGLGKLISTTKTKKQFLFFLIFIFILLFRQIEMTFDFDIFSFIQCSRKPMKNKIIDEFQNEQTNLGIEITPGSLTFFNSSFQTSSFPLTEYFPNCWSCIIRSISSLCRCRIVAATSFNSCLSDFSNGCIWTASSDWTNVFPNSFSCVVFIN